jgi:hypothetical protein
MDPGEIPIKINWFANPARVASALGLSIELPDLEIEDPSYWDNFDRDAWRAGLRGQLTGYSLLTGNIAVLLFVERYDAEASLTHQW